MSELKVNEYDVVLLKAVDGDTVDVDIDLGFGIWLEMNVFVLWALIHLKAVLQTK